MIYVTSDSTDFPLHINYLNLQVNEAYTSATVNGMDSDRRHLCYISRMWTFMVKCTKSNSILVIKHVSDNKKSINSGGAFKVWMFNVYISQTGWPGKITILSFYVPNRLNFQRMRNMKLGMKQSEVELCRCDHISPEK